MPIKKTLQNKHKNNQTHKIDKKLIKYKSKTQKVFFTNYDITEYIQFSNFNQKYGKIS